LVAVCTKKPLALFSTKSSIISLGLVCQDVFGTYDVVDEVEMDATVNNISVISWRSALLMEETGVPEDNHRPVTSY
jgi:hypothetical protein